MVKITKVPAPRNGSRNEFPAMEKAPQAQPDKIQKLRPIFMVVIFLKLSRRIAIISAVVSAVTVIEINAA